MIQPRSGDRSVAHGVSHGITVTATKSPGRVCRKNSFSLRNLSALCVSAVNLPVKTAHRRDAENAENAQSSFSDRLRRGET
jgi:hypothetical protein